MLKTLTFSILAVLVSDAIFAEEGMWLFNSPPLQQLQKRFQITTCRKWLTHIRKSSVRLNDGGSGSFVSENGLILTNQHVVSEAIQAVSSPEHNYSQTGFLARTLADEIKLPGVEIDRLESIHDVTKQVLQAIQPKMDAEEAFRTQRAIIAAIEKESETRTGLPSQVITLYGGAAFHLYCYKRYKDIRLVFAPEWAAAYFGGQFDNFSFPNYALDMAIVRAYENGQPVSVKHFLKLASSGVQEGDPVLMAGHPGHTERLLTTAAIETRRDYLLPLSIERLERWQQSLEDYARIGDEQKRQASEELFSIINSLQAQKGMLHILTTEQLRDAKAKAESRFKRLIEKLPQKEQALKAWKQIESAEEVYREIMVPLLLLEHKLVFNSPLFRMARLLVRMADEDLKPNENRLPIFRESNRGSLETELYANEPIYRGLELAKFNDSLFFLIEKLGPYDTTVRTILFGASPEELARIVVEGTRLDDVAERRRLAQGGRAAILASIDPMIQLARRIDETSRSLGEIFETRVQQPEETAYRTLSQIGFQIEGNDNLYPDATFTLRLSYGTVQGYSESDGELAPSWTTIGGAFDHEAAHSAAEPYQLPESWHSARAALNSDTPLVFVSTADMTGGNSGSPMVNRNGELVGLLFDGNQHSFLWDYIYDDLRARAIALDTRGISEVMAKVYRAQHLLDEMNQDDRVQTQ